MNPTKTALTRLVILLILSAVACMSWGDVSGDVDDKSLKVEKSQADFEKLLELMSIGPQQLATLPDGKSLDLPQRELVLRTLTRLDDLPPGKIQLWARQQKGIAYIAAKPDSARGHFYSMSGTVTSVKTVKLSPNDARRLMFKQYYRVQMILDDDKQSVILLTRAVPRAWLKQNNLSARATAWGLFLRLSENNSGQVLPVFAARRVAWHPPSVLSELGMDVGLLDDLQDRNTIGGHERECFYQMLAAVGRSKPGELIRIAQKELQSEDKKSFSVVPLFNDPAGQRGRLVLLSGTARRVVKVLVKDPDIVQRFGIRYYYEIYLYTPDSQDNPLVFCVRNLPEGMSTGSDPRYSQQIKVAGFFLKTWGYRPALADTPEGDSNTRQLAPLLIGCQPIRILPPEIDESNRVIGLIAGGLFIVAVLAIWIFLWRCSKKDRLFKLSRRTTGD